MVVALAAWSAGLQHGHPSNTTPPYTTTRQDKGTQASGTSVLAVLANGSLPDHDVHIRLPLLSSLVLH